MLNAFTLSDPLRIASSSSRRSGGIRIEIDRPTTLCITKNARCGVIPAGDGAVEVLADNRIVEDSMMAAK
jgi:hypothetical protein